jgi:hypothetical protein
VRRIYSVGAQKKLGRCAEKVQNIIDISRNSIDIFENSTDISTNFNDILTLLRAVAVFDVGRS